MLPAHSRWCYVRYGRGGDLPNFQFATGCKSAAGDDFDDFEAVAGLELALGKFGRGDGFAVMFDDDAAGEKVLRD
jgi:hypothetical protein